MYVDYFTSLRDLFPKCLFAAGALWLFDIIASDWHDIADGHALLALCGEVDKRPIHLVGRAVRLWVPLYSVVATASDRLNRAIGGAAYYLKPWRKLCHRLVVPVRHGLARALTKPERRLLKPHIHQRGLATGAMVHAVTLRGNILVQRAAIVNIQQLVAVANTKNWLFVAVAGGYELALPGRTLQRLEERRTELLLAVQRRVDIFAATNNDTVANFRYARRRYAAIEKNHLCPHPVQRRAVFFADKAVADAFFDLLEMVVVHGYANKRLFLRE